MFKIVCMNCKYEQSIKNCKENVNTRFQLSMYSIGCHYTKGSRFLANMNMPPPVSNARANQVKRKILKATREVAEKSMKTAAEELKSASTSSEVIVSCDGTWQRRGFCCKNGTATCLSVSKDLPAKVIDTETLSNHCDSCKKMSSKLTAKDFEKWKKHHLDCSKNHNAAAGLMEPEGLKRIFSRSESQYSLQYTGYLGDGDSKSFSIVSKLNPPIYSGKEIYKLECCGHVQIRMGKRLMDKVSENKNKTFTENGKTYRGIGGVGRLTKTAIKRIQGHYGRAIRKNIGNLDKMKSSIWAIWKHRGGNHKDCGQWCTLENRDKNILLKFVLNLLLKTLVMIIY
ncbi:hypothetical protein ElyMa_003564100 [Elysia marginata]|uniref:Mutator-like transposase domain-containing protein n=1 Tax=Elysia marginata TaxID=1093978 RepID=A0AAV4ELN2_9GAST|nr:hypothetical protein ElyMa_003564100 [Elysia marginata]